MNEPVRARIRWLSQTASADNGNVVDAPFVIEAFTEAGADVVQLNQPLTLTVQYAPGSLQNADETHLVLVAWNAALQQWIRIPAHLDTQQHAMRVSIDRLSRFALQLQERSLIYLPYIGR